MAIASAALITAKNVELNKKLSEELDMKSSEEDVKNNEEVVVS